MKTETCMPSSASRCETRQKLPSTLKQKVLLRHCTLCPCQPLVSWLLCSGWRNTGSPSAPLSRARFSSTLGGLSTGCGRSLPQGHAACDDAKRLQQHLLLCRNWTGPSFCCHLLIYHSVLASWWKYLREQKNKNPRCQQRQSTSAWTRCWSHAQE